ncbi:MAG: hypothetical protein OXG05_05380 [Gammaproteobacteria bacterium]|nr:hypothetical protein [Gammaproteobacteria bacterium]
MSDEDHKLKTTLPSRNWLLGLGVVLTTVWILGGLVYIVFLDGWMSFVDQRADAIGGFLEGFFAPLAFLWLVIGLFIQQRELASNTEALKQTNLNSEKQTEVLAATELRARQSAFFQIAENVRRQTGNLAGVIVGSLETEQGERIMSDARMIEHWEEHQRGQFEIFPAMLTDPAGAFAAAGLHPIDIYYGTEERSQTTSEYVKSFRGLIELARDCDDDGAIVRTITQTPHGQIYIAMLEHIRPPACWALLESASMFSPATEEIELFGTWHIRGETLYGDQEWYTTFRETENGIEGEVRLDDAVTAIQDFAIDGPAVFGRVVLSGNIFIMTGTVESGLLRGQLDIREGIFARFEGARV